VPRPFVRRGSTHDRPEGRRVTIETTDVIDRALGVEPGDRLDRVRRARPDAREHAQRSYDAIFAPTHPGALSVPERYALAYLVAAWHGVTTLTEHYRRALMAHERRPEVLEALEQVVHDGAGTGPFGRFAEAGLSGRDSDGLRLTLQAEHRDLLGDELAALVEHVHALVLRPRETSAASIDALVAVGWESTEIVAASQLVGFLAFQLRLVAGLAVLRSTWQAAA
jgi:CMD domain protein